jgi:hypothetical protein
MRLPPGCVILDAGAARLVDELLRIALQHRPRLWIVRCPEDRIRVRRLRDLAATCATSSGGSADVGTAEAVASGVAGTIRSGDRISVQEAAEVLQITTRRVTELLNLAAILGEQDAPGRPWRVDPESVHRLRSERKQAA